MNNIITGRNTANVQRLIDAILVLKRFTQILKELGQILRL